MIHDCRGNWTTALTVLAMKIITWFFFLDYYVLYYAYYANIAERSSDDPIKHSEEVIDVEAVDVKKETKEEPQVRAK